MPAALTTGNEKAAQRRILVCRLNDTDADGDALTATLVDGPDQGTLTLSSDGSFTYIPDTGV